MYPEKRHEIKDSYLDDGLPAFYLDSINQENFQKAYQKFNNEIAQKYSIEPSIISLQNKIEDEFLQKKAIQARVNERLNEEWILQNRFNELFPKKSRITPPFFKLKSERSTSMSPNPEPLAQMISDQTYENKGVQTIKQQMISQLILHNQGKIQNNSDFNINRREDPKKRIFHSDLKNKRERSEKYSPQAINKNDSKVLSKPLVENAEKDQMSFKSEVNKILLEAKGLIMKQRLQDADKNLDLLFRKNVNHADLFYLMGETKRLLGQFEKAEEMLLKSMSFEMHSPFCYYSLALVSMELKNFSRAINLWKIFLKFKENNVSAYFELAKCYLEVEDLIEAATCLNKAIDLDDRNPDFYLLRAQAFEMLNLEESAKTDYKKFKSLSPDFCLKYETEIKRFEDFGFYEEALKLRNFVRKIKNT